MQDLFIESNKTLLKKNERRLIFHKGIKTVKWGKDNSL